MMVGTAAASLHPSGYVLLHDPTGELVMHFLTVSSLRSQFLPGYVFSLVLSGFLALS